jgi:hypothetical protein
MCAGAFCFDRRLASGNAAVVYRSASVHSAQHTARARAQRAAHTAQHTAHSTQHSAQRTEHSAQWTVT